MHTSNITCAHRLTPLRRADWRVALIAAATLVASASASQAQVDLETYADAKGYINVKALTCAQLANTYQDDANFLGSGTAAGSTAT